MLVLQPVDGAPHRYSGDVGDDVERPARLVHVAGEGCDGLVVGDVEGGRVQDGAAAFTNAADDLVEGLLLQVGEHQPGPAFGSGMGQGAADSAGRAGHKEFGSAQVGDRHGDTLTSP